MTQLETSILAEDLEVGDIWNGKKVISVDAKDKSATVIIWLEGEISARAFFKGTQLLVTRQVKNILSENKK